MLLLEYIWIDAQGIPRSKLRCLDGKCNVLLPPAEQIPLWNFDGSSTGQDIGKDTEVVLKPVRVYHNPWPEEYGKEKSFLVLCQCDLSYEKSKSTMIGPGPILHTTTCQEIDMECPIPVPGFNTRAWAQMIAENNNYLDAWFGAEQEYCFTDPFHDGIRVKSMANPIKNNMPYMFNDVSSVSQGPYYCSVGYPHSLLAEIVREHTKRCLQAGIHYAGFNAEVCPAQWEFQIGPSDLLTVADDLVMARYLLLRLAAQKNVGVSFYPKLLDGWNGSGCHLNVSTVNTRVTGGSGMKEIYRLSTLLRKQHRELLENYGQDNHLRLTGKHETSSMEEFTIDVGTRHTSVRIPNMVVRAGGGYLEDRRPAANIDPYLAMGQLLTVLSGNHCQPTKSMARIAAETKAGDGGVDEESGLAETLANVGIKADRETVTVGEMDI